MSRVTRPPFAKRSLGQNFLVDHNYVRKIITAADPLSSDTIIEIGPGRGAITESLIDSGAKVIAFELDGSLASELSERFKTCSNFRVIEADATKMDFAAVLEGNKAKVVANLPYYISTSILQHLALQRENFDSLVLMFQKEVVERITAAPGDSERGYLTVLTELAFSVEHLFDVPPNAFRPVPKVTSSVARLVPKPRAELSEERFRGLVSAAFAQKRKTIVNNLKGRYPGARDALVAAGIDPMRRAESLRLEEWIELLGTLDHIALGPGGRGG